MKEQPGTRSNYNKWAVRVCGNTAWIQHCFFSISNKTTEIHIKFHCQKLQSKLFLLKRQSNFDKTHTVTENLHSTVVKTCWILSNSVKNVHAFLPPCSKLCLNALRQNKLGKIYTLQTHSPEGSISGPTFSRVVGRSKTKSLLSHIGPHCNGHLRLTSPQPNTS